MVVFLAHTHNIPPTDTTNTIACKSPGFTALLKFLQWEAGVWKRNCYEV